MGLLDDAIREHLELKRRRGADPAEIERAEREALGPVRRHPEGAEDPFADQAQADEELDYEFAREEPYEDDLPYEDEYEEPEPGRSGYRDDAPERGRAAYRDDEPEPYPSGSEPRWDDDPPATGHVSPAEPIPPVTEHVSPAEPIPPMSEHVSPAEPIPPADDIPRTGHVPPRADDPLSQETREYSSLEEHEPPSRDPHEDRGADDMLEETPDFLQDTPDHDRLWFEQRPPKDFDFDS